MKIFGVDRIRLLLILCCLVAVHSQQISWTLLNPYPTTSNLVANAYGNGIYLAIADDGSSLTSPDLVTFTNHPASQNSNYLTFPAPASLCYFAPSKMFYAVGKYGGTGCLASTSDGSNWNLILEGTSFEGLACGDDRIVASYFFSMADGHYYKAISTDGLSFNISPFNLLFTNIFYQTGNHTFIGIPFGSGTQYIYSSTDGDNWTSHPVPQISRPTYAAGAYGNGVTVLIGSDVIYSKNLQKWNTAFHTDIVTRNIDIGYDGNTFALLRQKPDVLGLVHQIVLTSPDGSNWNNVMDNYQIPSMQSIITNNSKYYIVGSGGSLVTSVDGVNWIVPTGFTWETIRWVQYSKSSGYFAYGHMNIYTSQDGKQWTPNQISFDQIQLLQSSVKPIWSSVFNKWYTYSPNGGGNSPVIMYSTNGQGWVKMPYPPTSRSLTGLTSTDVALVACSPDGVFSWDGSSWTSIASTVSSLFYAGNKQLLAFNYTYNSGSFIQVSLDDGATWQVSEFNSTCLGSQVSFASNGYVIIVAGRYCIGSAPIGNTAGQWRVYNTYSQNNIAGAFLTANTLFVACDMGGICYFSEDGLNWVYNSISSTLQETQAIAVNDLSTNNKNQIVVVGNSGLFIAGSVATQKLSIPVN